ncbi:MAG: hypothetical protein ABIE75_01215 [Candidatus Omnitrophota bacterium]
MKEKRKFFGAGKISRYKFVNFLLVFVLMLAFMNAFASMELLEEGKMIFKSSIGYYIFQFILVAIGLVGITTLGYILHYGFGAIARIEKILENIAEGNYSLRIHLRKKDIMQPLAVRINKILDLLEKKTNKNQTS